MNAIATDKDCRLFFLHALSPLHVGVEGGLGAIDMPTMREVHTGHPIVPGSSVKGVLRDAAVGTGGSLSPAMQAAFGPGKLNASENRGGLVFTDARLLCLPVRSLVGTFAWITCPLAWGRFQVDAERGGRTVDSLSWPTGSGDNNSKVKVSKGSALTFSMDGPPKEGKAPNPSSSKVYLEDFLFEVAVDSIQQGEGEVAPVAESLARLLFSGDPTMWEFFKQRFAMVSNDVFSYFCRLGMEVRTRVPIDRNTGTAATSGPFTEELMPTETVLYGMVVGRNTVRPKEERKDGTKREMEPSPAASHLETLRKAIPLSSELRFGGHSSVGFGRARFHLMNGG